MNPRLMYRWVAPNGTVVAELLQGVKFGITGPRATYLARVSGGEQVEKERFTCAKRVIDQWLLMNRIHATLVNP